MIPVPDRALPLRLVRPSNYSGAFVPFGIQCGILSAYCQSDGRQIRPFCYCLFGPQSRAGLLIVPKMGSVGQSMLQASRCLQWARPTPNGPTYRSPAGTAPAGSWDGFELGNCSFADTEGWSVVELMK